MPEVLKQKDVSLMNRPKYEPGYVEKHLVEHMVQEWEENEALMKHVREKLEVIHQMQHGRYVRDPDDPSDYALVYTPYIRKDHEDKVGLVMQRTIPDSQTMDMLRINITEDPDDELAAIVAPQMGVDPSQIAAEASRVLTAAVREEIKKSNLVSFLRDAYLDWNAKGTAIGLVDIDYRVEMVPELEVVAQGGISEDGNDAEDVAESATTGERFVELPVFSGLRFERIPIENLNIGDLEFDKGPGELDSIGIYMLRDFRRFKRFQMRKRNGERYAGCYVNVEHLRPADMDENPSRNDASLDRGTEDFTMRTKGPSNRSFKTLFRMCKIRWENIDAFQKQPPTGAQWREFREKFGINKDVFASEQTWIVEIVYQSMGSVCVRCEPTTANKMVTACRKYKVDGETLGNGDYHYVANWEIIANDMDQAVAEAVNQSTRPMQALYKGAIERRWLEEHGDQLTWRPNGIVPVTTNQNPLFPILPTPTAIRDASEYYQHCRERIREFTGMSPQFRGADSGAETATENRNQQSYLEQNLTAEQQVFEIEFVLPLLREFVAKMLAMIQQNGGYTFTINRQNLHGIWGDKYKGLEKLVYDITPEMVQLGYDIEITTSGLNSNSQEQITRMQQGLGMALQLYQGGFLGDHVIDGVEFMKTYNAMLRIQSPFIRRQQDVPVIAQMAMMKQMQGKDKNNPSSMGASMKSDYDRSATEIPAPGEPIAGQTPSIAQAQDSGAPVGSGMLGGM